MAEVLNWINNHVEGLIFIAVFLCLYILIDKITTWQTKNKIQRAWKEFSFWMTEEQKQIAFPIWVEISKKYRNWPKNYCPRR